MVHSLTTATWFWLIAPMTLIMVLTWVSIGIGRSE